MQPIFAVLPEFDTLGRHQIARPVRGAGDVAAVGIAMSFSVPGIPSGGLLIAAPYFQAIGLPPQGIGILIALDAIPDIFKTLVIVQSHVSATMIVAGREAGAPEPVRALETYPASSDDQYIPS